MNRKNKQVKKDIKSAVKAFSGVQAMSDTMKAHMETEKELLKTSLTAIGLTEGIDNAIRTMKNEFGDIMYTVLCPINGYPLKNRRYADGTSKNLGRDTAEGPAVHQKIGSVSSWSSKASWYTATEVWEKFTQEHVDLIHNGIKSRHNHKETAQEFLDVREQINDILSPKNEEGERMSNQKVNIEIDPIAVDMMTVRYEDNIMLCKDPVSLFIWGGRIGRNGIECLVAEAGWKGDEADVKNYSIRFDNPNCEWRGENYSTKIIGFGFSELLKQKAVTDAYTELLSKYKEALQVWQDCKDKYAGAVMLKGTF
jgi:hypothetical protein